MICPLEYPFYSLYLLIRTDNYYCKTVLPLKKDTRAGSQTIKTSINPGKSIVNYLSDFEYRA
jgi:hypothetical protein